MTGCTDSHPDKLVGTWNEIGYSRQIVFDKEDVFNLIEFAHQPQGISSGTGTWEVKGNELVVKLESGHMNWADLTAAAPSTLVFEYTLSGKLTLMEAEGIESATYNKIDADRISH